MVKTRTSAFDLGIYILISDEFAFSQNFILFFSCVIQSTSNLIYSTRGKHQCWIGFSILECKKIKL